MRLLMRPNLAITSQGFFGDSHLVICCGDGKPGTFAMRSILLKRDDYNRFPRFSTRGRDARNGGP